MPKIVIELEIDGPASEAMSIVEGLLDAGTLQDDIKSFGDSEDVEVISATHYLVDEKPSGENDGWGPGPEGELRKKLGRARGLLYTYLNTPEDASREELVRVLEETAVP